MHKSVLLKEVIEYLNPKPEDVILDATINGGGHAKAILNLIGKKGKLIGIEQDAEILEKLKSENLENAVLIDGNFRDLDELLSLNNIKELNGAIFDLGMSSLHLEESGRGFSFQKNEPLLMTFKSYLESSDLTAKDILNEWSEKEISDILFNYGEERYSRGIAKRIIERRKEKPFETTFDLVSIVEASVPGAYRRGRIHCATRTFQALRIAVNDEMESLKTGIRKAWEMLSPKSRLTVISFHSLEDRIVKVFFKDLKESGEGKILTKKPVIASEDEMKENPRSRSAKLRAIEKIKQ